MRKRKYIDTILYYPLRVLRSRPAVLCSGAAVLFCLLSLTTLSLLLAESAYMADFVREKPGSHTGVLYRLDREQLLLLQKMEGELEADFHVIPVYARLEGVDPAEELLSVTVLTAEAGELFAIPESDVPAAGEIVLPAWAEDPYYAASLTRSCFFHGQNGRGEKTGLSVTRPLQIRSLSAYNWLNLPYAFVTPETAEDIRSAAEGEITYDVYFTTHQPSDYAGALLLDTLLPALDWYTPPEDSGIPGQALVNHESRRVRYGEFLNYPLLDLLNREYMDDPSFFFLLLPVMLAAAFAMAGLLREDLELHSREYGLLKASGAGQKTLYGTLYAMALLQLLIAAVPACLTTAVIAQQYTETGNAALAGQGIAYRFSIPLGNILTVYLYTLVFACILLYFLTKPLLSCLPAHLLRNPGAENVPGNTDVQTSAWQALHAKDPVGYIVKVQFRRERKRRLLQGITSALLMGVCGYMVVTMLLGRLQLGETELEWMHALYLYGAYLLLAVLTASGEIRQQRREFAILRQCGTPDRTLKHRIRLMQLHTTLLALGITAVLFVLLAALPALLSAFLGGLLDDTPMMRYLFSAEYQGMVLFSGAAALLLQLGNLLIGQLVMLVPVHRMLKRGILTDLRGTE